MMRRRFRRRRASWQYADSQVLVMTGPSASAVAWCWLLPPARVKYLAQARNRDSLTFAGCHLWLDFRWKSTGAANNLVDVDFGVIKTTIADPVAFTPDLSLVQGQWDQPTTPATLTAWDEDDDSGVDSWLWQHHIKGMTPPNAGVQTPSSNENGNQGIVLNGSVDAPTFECRKFFVTQEWQPDVVVRSKRRLQKDEGILLYMSGDFPVNTLNAELDVKFRTLVM